MPSDHFITNDDVAALVDAKSTCSALATVGAERTDSDADELLIPPTEARDIAREDLDLVVPDLSQRELETLVRVAFALRDASSPEMALAQAVVAELEIAREQPIPFTVAEVKS